MQQSASIAIVFIVGCAAGGVAAQLVALTVRAGTTPARWEYLCLRVGTNGGGMTSSLNKPGAEGWELASVALVHMDHVWRDSYVCSKRALP